MYLCTVFMEETKNGIKKGFLFLIPFLYPLKHNTFCYMLVIG